ncbi:ATP-binding cassette domain-containing protein [Pelagibacterales bacterium SAG-MED48]|nr:ATP-binding cassette domain-containing protein [Pelagibacterales bacterium SAG-MED48]
MSLELKNVEKKVGIETHIYSTNLKLEKNTINVLLGSTLAGKTTLMQIMAGLDKPTSGEIWFNGENVTGKEVQKRNCSMVYQQFINYPNFTVFENIASPLKITGVKQDEIKERVGKVVYTAMCYENGCMLDDGTLFKFGQDNFRWIGGDEYSGEWLKEQAKKKNYKVWIKSATDHIHNIAVQGPNSRKILEKFVWTAPIQPSISELEWFRFNIARIDHETGTPIVISRTGYTGELGYEIWCHPKDADEVWDKVWEAGKEFDITPLGLEALDMVRIEAGLIFYGYEFDDQTDPFEAGIGFTVPLKTKEDEFIGKEELIKRKANPQKKLVGLELIGHEPAVHGDCVHVGRAQIGVITSGMLSPKLGKNIALCRIDIKYSELGTDVEIGKLDGHQKRIGAKVVAFPFYDPTKSRVRA